MNKNIFKIINNKGFKAFVVGGYVRDILIGVESNDLDIATDATPTEIMGIFKDIKGWKVVPTGIEYGTITIYHDKHAPDGVEITTFRGERYDSLSRKPAVEYVNDITEDLSRRDFTINAIAYDPIKDIYVDPFNGKKDIKEKIIKFVGDEDERIIEDPLRLLRALRFSCRYNFKIDETSLNAIIKNVNEIDRISPERIRGEIIKVLKQSTSPRVFFDLAYQVGLLEKILPEVAKLKGVNQNSNHHMYDVYEHTMVALTETRKLTNDPAILMAVLFHDIGKHTTKIKKGEKIIFPSHFEVSSKMAGNILKRLKFSNNFITEVMMLIKHHDIGLSGNWFEIWKSISNITKGGKNIDIINKLEIVRISDCLAQKNGKSKANDVKEMFKQIRMNIPNTPLSPNDVTNGKEVIRLMEKRFGKLPKKLPMIGGQHPVKFIQEKVLHEIWKEKIPNTKESIRSRIKEIINSISIK